MQRIALVIISLIYLKIPTPHKLAVARHFF